MAARRGAKIALMTTGFRPIVKKGGVQHFEITIGALAASNTATINSVRTNKSVIFFGGYQSPFTSGGFDENSVRLELTNATTVTAYRNSALSAHTVTVRGCVVEFEDWAVKSVEHGTITISSGNTTNNATITGVKHGVPFYLGQTVNSATTNTYEVESAIELTSSTNLLASRGNGAGGNDVVIGYSIVDFNPSVVVSIQKVAFSIQNTSATDNVTLTTPVNLNNAFLVNGGHFGNSSAEPGWFMRAQLTDSVTVNILRAATSNIQRDYRCYIVELRPGLIKSVQRAGISMNAGTASAQATINAVETGKTAVSFSGNQVSNTTPDAAQYASARLQDSTTLDMDRSDSTTVVHRTFLEAIEFA